MAAIVQNITTSGKDLIATLLGSTYKELRFVFAVEKNDIRSAEKAYGFRPLEASTAETTVKTYTLDHRFEVVLTDTIGRSDDDVQRTDAINQMYNNSDEIFKEFINTKLGLPLTVLNISEQSISEPEFVLDNKLVILRMQMTVKYRSSLL
jgi:hypothetical protein